MNAEFLFIPEDPNNDVARGHLGRLSESDFVIREVQCLPGTTELYAMPAITLDDGRRFFGIELIKNFVEAQLNKAKP